MRLLATLVTLGGTATALSEYKVDASRVDRGTKTAWCESQFNVCRDLCEAGGGGTEKDTCNVGDLSYECMCRNGTAPGLEFYKGSMPFSLCQRSFDICVQDNVGNAKQQKACEEEIFDGCPTLDPAKATAQEDDDAQDDKEDDKEDDGGGGGGDGGNGNSDADARSASPSSSDASDPSATSEKPSQAGRAKIHNYANAAAAVAIGLTAYLL